MGLYKLKGNIHLHEVQPVGVGCVGGMRLYPGDRSQLTS